MNTSNKLKIIPYIITIFYYIKNYNINKTLKILLIYELLNFIFNIILNSIDKINYRSTVIGFIHTMYKKYINKIKKIIYYYLLANFNLLTIYKQLIPDRLYRSSGINYDVGIKSLIISLIILVYSIVSDLYFK